MLKGSNRLQTCLPLAALLCLYAATATLAAEPQPAASPGGGQDHSQHGGQVPAASAAPLSEASQAYEAASQKMHKGMATGYTGDVDVDFVRGMIPHHQGAIDQAEILLKYSKNPRLRRLAGGIIAAQKREIRFMENWLKEHAAGVETGDMPDWLKSTPNPSNGAGNTTAPAKD